MGPMAGEHEGRMGPIAGGSYQDPLPFLQGGPCALATHRTASTTAPTAATSLDHVPLHPSVPDDLALLLAQRGQQRVTLLTESADLRVT